MYEKKHENVMKKKDGSYPLSIPYLCACCLCVFICALTGQWGSVEVEQMEPECFVMLTDTHSYGLLNLAWTGSVGRRLNSYSLTTFDIQGDYTLCSNRGERERRTEREGERERERERERGGRRMATRHKMELEPA